MEKSIPSWEKYSLSFSEASAYFGIGEKKLRNIVSENPDADYILEIGSHVRIKREAFEKHLSNIKTL